MLADPPELAAAFWGVWSAGITQIMGRQITVVLPHRCAQQSDARNLHRVIGLGPGMLVTDAPLGKVLGACDAAIVPLAEDWPVATVTMIGLACGLGTPVIVPAESSHLLAPIGGVDAKCLARGARPRDMAAVLDQLAGDPGLCATLGDDARERLISAGVGGLFTRAVRERLAGATGRSPAAEVA